MTGKQTIERALEIVSVPGNQVEARAHIKVMYADWDNKTSGERGWQTKGDIKLRTGQLYRMLKTYAETNQPQTLTKVLRDELALVAAMEADAA